MSGAVRTSAGAVVPVGEVELTGGLLHAWQQRNRVATIPHSIGELRKAGNLENLRRLADPSVGPYRGRYPFLDTDLYKTLEGLAYEVGREDAPAGAREFFDEVVGLLEQAQAGDGPFLHSSRFVLVDAQSRIRGYYDSNEAEALARLRQDLAAVAGGP